MKKNAEETVVMKKKLPLRRQAVQWGITIVIVLIAALMVAPFVWMITSMRLR